MILTDLPNAMDVSQFENLNFWPMFSYSDSNVV